MEENRTPNIIYTWMLNLNFLIILYIAGIMTAGTHMYMKILPLYLCIRSAVLPWHLGKFQQRHFYCTEVWFFFCVSRRKIILFRM